MEARSQLRHRPKMGQHTPEETGYSILAQLPRRVKLNYDMGHNPNDTLEPHVNLSKQSFAVCDLFFCVAIGV